MNTRLFSAAAALLVVAGAEQTQAQITTVVAPPKRAEVNAQDSVRREQVMQDSIARVTLTGMKEWVDSAAQALALRPDTGLTRADTAAAVATTPTQRVDSASQNRPAAEAQPEFREGGRAPDTATLFPTLALVGGVMVLAGIAVGRRGRAPAVSRRR